MENKVLEKNIDRIKQYDSKLANSILTTDEEKSNIIFQQTEKGEYNILYNNIPLHNSSGIIEECQAIISNIKNKEATDAVRIVYGFGLGYLVDMMSEVIKGKIIVYEPNLDILKAVFSIAQVDAIFKDNVIVCSNKNSLTKAIVNNTTTDTIMTLNALPSYKKLYKEDIEETITVAQRAKAEHKVHENTYYMIAPKAIWNTFSNLQYIFQSPCMSDFKDIYKGKTAILLSAGPSLRKNIEIIKENQDKFVIFAVNPTLKLLKEFDITPDFVVAVEANDIAGQFYNIDMSKCCLIIEGFSNTNIHTFSAKRKINYISNSNFLNFWLRDCLGLTDYLESRGTVSYTMLYSAYIMGFSRLILCGQDLAYSDGACYAKGSQFEELECVYDEDSQKYVIKARDYDKYVQSFVNERVDVEQAKRGANYNIRFLNNNVYTVESQDGKKLPTQTGYALFIDWFSNAAESFKDENPDIELINSSTGGAQIDGFENIPLSEVIQKLNKTEKIDLTNIQHKFDKNHAAKKVNVMYENLKNFKTILEDLNAVNHKLIKEIDIKKTITPNIIKLLQKHEEYLFKALGEKNNPEIKEVILIFLNNYVSIVDKDYYSDVNVCKSTVLDVIRVTDEIMTCVNVFLKGLTDCKPFVL